MKVTEPWWFGHVWTIFLHVSCFHRFGMVMNNIPPTSRKKPGHQIWYRPMHPGTQAPRLRSWVGSSTLQVDTPAPPPSTGGCSNTCPICQEIRPETRPETGGTGGSGGVEAQSNPQMLDFDGFLGDFIYAFKISNYYS